MPACVIPGSITTAFVMPVLIELIQECLGYMIGVGFFSFLAFTMMHNMTPVQI
jgi:hypothetical protein